jgi:hypothetical protein
MTHTSRLQQGTDGLGPRVRFERVTLDSLRPHPRNARRGQLGLISESLRTHGQYRSIVAQRSTRYVLAGNHVFLAARDLGFEHLDVHFLDVDDDAATRVLLLDNRVGELAEFDDSALFALLGEIPDLDGTGYGTDDLDELIARLDHVTRAEKAQLEMPRRGGSASCASPSSARVSPGDLIQLGPDRLACVDGRDLTTLAKLFGSQAGSLAECGAAVEAAVDSAANSFSDTGVGLYVLSAGEAAGNSSGGLVIISVFATAGTNARVAQAFSGVGEQLELSDAPPAIRTALIPDAELCLQIVEAWEADSGARGEWSE